VRQAIAFYPKDGATGICKCKVSQVGGALTKVGPKKGWAKLYKREWGGLKRFLEACDDDFIVDDAAGEVMLIGSGAGATTESTANDDGWRKKVDGGKTVASADPGSASVSESQPKGASGQGAAASSSASAHQSGLGSKELKDAAFQAMHTRLARRYGRWFSFDDSRVRPACFMDIEQTFSGSSSGYLLFYRSRALGHPAVEGRAKTMLGGPAGPAQEAQWDTIFADASRLPSALDASAK